MVVAPSPLNTFQLTYVQTDGWLVVNTVTNLWVSEMVENFCPAEGRLSFMELKAVMGTFCVLLVRTSVQYTYTYAYTYTYTYGMYVCIMNMRVRMCRCMHAHTHTHTVL
jgi:hypothetical protein